MELVEAALKLREPYPRWGKDKLVVLLHREGFDCSASMVGRIIRKLKERGVLQEPMPNYISARRRRWQRPYATIKPKEYVVKKPGDIVAVLLKRMPFPIKAIQVDRGSEFQDAFERECQQRSIKLFVLPPRSPKLNGHVERAQRTHTEEFYEITEASFEIRELNQALGYLTPLEFLEQYQQKKKGGNVSLII